VLRHYRRCLLGMVYTPVSMLPQVCASEGADRNLIALRQKSMNEVC